MKRLYFVRHALSEDNKRGVFSGSSDTDLAEEGVEQAKKVGRFIKNHHPIDVIVSSPMKRTKKTAELIADEIGLDKSKILFSELLIERELGELEGTPYPSARPVHMYKNVETMDDLLKRVAKAHDWINSLGHDNVLVISHGATGRALRKIVQPKSDLREKIGNAEVQQWL